MPPVHPPAFPPHSPSPQDLACTVRRDTLGLTLRLFLDPGRPSSPLPHYVDPIFACAPDNLQPLIDHLLQKRPDLTQRLHHDRQLTILIPQTDPPPIRISTRTPRGAYFNLGELWRWRFLNQHPHYPFKTHQETGVKWLHDRPHALLADDMGLGKTLQAIAALALMHTATTVSNALVACPKSLIGVWEAELSLWAPHLCTVALHSTIRPGEWPLIAAQSHVVVTNYDALRRSRPQSHTFDLVIFDEIQKLKNPKSHNYAAAYDLRPRFAWGLTGTPLENHPGDLAAILHLIDRKRISHSDQHLPLPALRSIASNYILRRGRSVISDELPEVIEKTELLPLMPEQQHTYDRLRRNPIPTTLGAWLALFNRLRDTCDYDRDTLKSAKIDRALAIIAAVSTLGEKVVVFSWRLRPLRLLNAQLATQHGSLATATITGHTTSTTRSAIVEAFQSTAMPFVLLCSTRATAEGLTLTAANHVVFLNEWWNPAVNAQARDRVNRIGQKRTVYVYRLRSQGTVESRLDELLRRKSVLFDQIVRRLAAPSAAAQAPVPDGLSALLDTDPVPSGTPQ